MKTSTRGRAIGALRDLAIRFCVGGGFLLGLLAGLQGRPRSANCAGGEACVGEQFALVMWAVFGPALAGAVAGLGLSLVVVLVLKRLRTPRERAGAR